MNFHPGHAGSPMWLGKSLDFDLSSKRILRTMASCPAIEKMTQVSQKKKVLTMISIVPLEILVGMAKAWKKEVFSGPRPVF